MDIIRICDPKSNFGCWFSMNLGIFEEWTVVKILIALAALEEVGARFELNLTLTA